MSKIDLIQAMDDLDGLLEAERNVLLTGKLEALAGMVDEKERLIDALSYGSDETPPDALGRLSSKVKRNQLLLDGALEGIRTVARRLALLRKVRGSLETYNAQGTRQSIEMVPESTVEKRA